MLASVGPIFALSLPYVAPSWRRILLTYVETPSTQNHVKRELRATRTFGYQPKASGKDTGLVAGARIDSR